ncbi:MAG: gamma-glutamyl-gamma-aminobutyrate hydrolase family protein [Betaproteobacteria bacterium]|nr:gamma-glutamyl-gamma-aminobutyrate hydrolase family protein [Betaproteobacteria bacterium]
MKRTLKIGLSARLSHPRPGAIGLESKTLQYLEQSVAQWIMARDVLVFMVPSITQDGMLDRSSVRLRDYAQHLDGLVLQGGADLNPMTYGEEAIRPEWMGDRTRDMYEMELLMEFLENRKPVLGICRGAQLINVAMGGSLYQDIRTQIPDAIEHLADSYDRHTHELVLEPGGLMEKLLGNAPQRKVISIHHQGIRTLGRDLAVEARAAGDNMIEAIRGTGRGFLLGLQWHPEFRRPSDEDVLDCLPLLENFLEACRSGRWL